ncbi:MAG TPA: TetR/AcrR family transcriptional regulator [Mycobacteriales bacterium]|nr:TetR/AcrR family transcriptional regulator [Mycobacteriales bacterium]
MVRRPDPETKPRLLAQAVEYVAQHGVAELSLRQLAAALGTSHRMLSYHFGSKEGLLVEVVKAVEERQRAALADLDAELPAGHPPAELLRALWRRLADPALWPHERLFFEMYGQALMGNPKATPLLAGIVDSWLAPAVDLARRRGLPGRTAAADARLALAVVRGLLLDLLATGDRAGVDAAMERFVEWYSSGWPEPTSKTS